MNPEQIQSLIDARIAHHFDERFAGIESQVASLLQSVNSGGGNIPEHRASLVVLSGDLDKLFAAFSIAIGAASSGMSVSMFFTFWGLNALRTSRSFSKKSFSEKMITAMLPGDPGSVPSSRLNMLGLGPVFFKHLMKSKKVESLTDMISLARELGVNMIACETSMSVMGIQRGELLDGLEYAGVATFLESAMKSKFSLFI
jgi:peroxiredoxin family protein